jgi:hypothetical protein
MSNDSLAYKKTRLKKAGQDISKNWLKTQIIIII